MFLDRRSRNISPEKFKFKDPAQDYKNNYSYQPNSYGQYYPNNGVSYNPQVYPQYYQQYSSQNPTEYPPQYSPQYPPQYPQQYPPQYPSEYPPQYPSEYPPQYSPPSVYIPADSMGNNSTPNYSYNVQWPGSQAINYGMNQAGYYY